MVNNQKLLELLQGYKLTDLEKALKDNVREELQKAGGVNKSDAAIIKNIVKLASKSYNKSLLKAHPFNISGVDYFGFTNGHYIIAGPESYGYDIAEPHEVVGMDRFFSSDAGAGCMELDVKEIAMFAKDKQNKIKNYQYTVLAPEGFYISFNAKYMIDCLTYCNTTKIIYNTSNVINCLKSPIQIKSDDGKKLALCLPVSCACSDAACSAYDYMEKWRKNEL